MKEKKEVLSSGTIISIVINIWMVVQIKKYIFITYFRQQGFLFNSDDQEH